MTESISDRVRNLLRGEALASQDLVGLSAEETGSRLLGIITSSKSDQAIAEAGDLLADLRDPRAFDALVTASNRADSFVGARAIYALARLQDHRAEAVLVSELAQGDRPDRQTLAFALGSFPGQSSLQALLGCFQDPDRYVRMAAIRSVGSFRMPETFDVLTSLVEDPARQVPEPAFAALQVRAETWAALEQFRATPAEGKLIELEGRERARIVAAFRSRVGSHPWRDMLHRSNQAPDAFAASRGFEPDLMAFCDRLAPKHNRSSLYSVGYSVWPFLDGGLVKAWPYGMGESKRNPHPWVEGASAPVQRVRPPWPKPEATGRAGDPIGLGPEVGGPPSLVGGASSGRARGPQASRERVRDHARVNRYKRVPAAIQRACATPGDSPKRPRGASKRQS